MKRLLIMFIMVIGLIGCDQPSMNVQRSASRDAGDLGVTIYLDKVQTGEVQNKTEKILEIVNEIENLLNQGKAGDLTVGFVRNKVNTIVPIEYQDLSDTILHYLADFEVPTDKIPNTALKNIRAALLGIKRGVAEYQIQDRKQIESEPKIEP